MELPGQVRSQIEFGNEENKNQRRLPRRRVLSAQTVLSTMMTRYH